MAISRKKAVDAMTKVYSDNHGRYQVMLMAENIGPESLFPFREQVIAKIQRGKNPLEVVDSMIETAIRTTLLERRMSNAYNPQLRDVISDEVRDLLNQL